MFQYIAHDAKEGFGASHIFKVENQTDGILLSMILDFSDKLLAFINGLELNQNIAILPASFEKESVAQAFLYVGCYMIICEGLTVEAVQDALQESGALSQEDDFISNPAKDIHIHIVDCWRAVEQAVKLDWLVRPDSDIEPVLDVEELAHYANRANGSLHLAVPGRMFFFPSPDDVPDGQQWADYDAGDGTTARRFSAAYYAELFTFEELNVSVVACLG